MLVIRMQRTGRKGHAQFRVVVQDSRRTPTSGKVVAQLGHYDPHSKQTVLDKEKAQFYLDHGAQPSDRAARLLKAEGVKLPKWVQLESKRKGEIRNPEKLRRNRPADVEAPADKPAETEAPAEAAPAEESQAAEAPAENAAEAPTEADNQHETAEQTPAEPEAEPSSADEAPADSAEEVKESNNDEAPVSDEKPAEESEPEQK